MQAVIDMNDANLGKRNSAKDSETKEEIEEGQTAADVGQEKKKMMKSFRVVDGVAPVDEYVMNRERYRVCQLFGKTYSKILCSSSVTDNKNKFYVLQMLEEVLTGCIFVYFRWGRIGARGMDSLIPFQRDTGAAMAEFDTKLKDKVVEGSYEELDIVFDDETTIEEQEKQMLSSIQSTKLPKAVAELVRDIFSLRTIKNNVKDIGYDAKKMPLGKLSQNNIKMGFNILKFIMKELEKDKPDMAKIEKDSSKFYTFVPHDVGFKDMRSMVIKTKEICQKKIEELENLSEIKIAMGIIEQEQEQGGNSLDRYYSDLKNEINALDKDHDDFKMLENYLKTTHGKTHTGFSIELLDAFHLQRQCESQSFKADLGNRMLLWHGSRMSNYAGILSQGLRIAPPEAPSTGYMFGKGVYFADMASKSAQYCHSHLSDGVALLLLCDVAVGTPNDLLHSDYNASVLSEVRSYTRRQAQYEGRWQDRS